MSRIAALALCALLASTSFATVLYNFESGAQGWGSFGPVTSDSGPIAGSVGQGRYHAFDTSIGGWGIVDVSPATNLSAYTGLTVDARLVSPLGNFPVYVGNYGLDFGVEVGGVEYYAAPITLTGAFQTCTLNFAGLVPGGSDMSGALIKLRLVTAGGAGVGRVDYDQVTGVPEPAALVLLGLLAALRRR